ncbi:hypothetical protein D3C71_2186470 [compost metagenome]
MQPVCVQPLHLYGYRRLRPVNLMLDRHELLIILPRKMGQFRHSLSRQFLPFHLECLLISPVTADEPLSRIHIE